MINKSVKINENILFERFNVYIFGSLYHLSLKLKIKTNGEDFFDISVTIIV